MARTINTSLDKQVEEAAKDSSRYRSFAIGTAAGGVLTAIGAGAAVIMSLSPEPTPYFQETMWGYAAVLGAASASLNYVAFEFAQLSGKFRERANNLEQRVHSGEQGYQRAA